jgi:hypothetical protein
VAGSSRAGEITLARHLDPGAVARAERDAQACRLRTQGWSFQEIADKLGFGHRSGARDAIRKVLLETLQAPADELRAEELLLFRRVIREAFGVVENPPPMVDRAGKPVVLEGDDGKPYAVPDANAVTGALQVILKASDARRAMMGLNAPARKITASLTLQEAQELAISNGVPAAVVYGQAEDGGERATG